MKALFIAAAIIVVVIALLRALVGTLLGAEPTLSAVLVEAVLAALILAPLLKWLIGGPTVSATPAPAAPSDDGNIDPLSNTLSLRGLTINLLELMALAERYERDMAIVMLSLDDTDDIHERFGDAGVEAALLMMGDTLIEALRVPDRAGRYEGGTFLLILPETNEDGARLIAERVRRAVVDTSVRAGRSGSFTVSASAGVASFRNGDDPQAITGRAKTALAEARDLGRNRTVVAT